MKSARVLALAALTLGSLGCYQQVVRTGLPPGPTVVDREWVATWIFGLVAADPVNVRAECPDGVAIVRTQQSFLNGLVGILTLGIYTPQHVTVTCAQRTAQVPGALEVRVADSANDAERVAALQSAIAESLARGLTVIVRY